MDVGSRLRSTPSQNYDIYQRKGRENGHIILEELCRHQSISFASEMDADKWSKLRLFIIGTDARTPAVTVRTNNLAHFLFLTD